MKLSVILLFLATSLDAAQKKKSGKNVSNKNTLSAKRRKEARSPLATRNTEYRACHKIKKGVNEQSLSAINNSKGCKCLTGWKKWKNKELDQQECVKINTKLLRNKKMIEEYETYAEAKRRTSDGSRDTGKCIVVTGEEKIVDCSNVGFDSKKAKKILTPADTKVVDWSNNHIQEVHFTWYEGLLDLERLSFRNNFLRTLDPHTFRGSYNLKEIDLSFNQFAAFNNSGLFKKNPNVRVLKINNNMISELKLKVVSVLQYLERFEVQNNRIRKVTGGILSKASDLVYADFSNNHISKVATKAFANNELLKELYLNNNMITVVNKKLLESQKNLVTLRLDFNKIVNINKSAMRKLLSVKTILLNNNQIAGLTDSQFKGLRSLEKINLDHNQIKTVGKDVFMNCDNLKYVFIRYNKINNLNGATFTNNPLLKIAFISHNNLDEIEEDLLSGHSDLKRLDIGDNKLSTVGNVLEGSQDKLENFYMYNNTLQEADDNLIASAPVLKAVDASKNELTDTDLKFISNAIDGSPELNKVNLDENQFTNPNLDKEFEGASDISKLKTEIENAQTL